MILIPPLVDAAQAPMIPKMINISGKKVGQLEIGVTKNPVVVNNETTLNME